ncbi:MAG: hypothetical protein K0R18_35 [Bacillales bacterium]|nr:hypothetical protein [Bacillales bacterium]
MARLKKVAELQELNELNMSSNVLNVIIQTKDASDTVSNVVYRRLMNNNTKLVVEIWELTGEKYAVFSGHYQGQWTANNIEMSEIFDSLNEAQLYVQTELQGEAEVNQLIVSFKRLNNYKKIMAKGGEPNYNQIAKDFQKEVNIPDVEMHHKEHINKYYGQFQDYMKQYYPEWAKYPAYIWGGWGHFTNLVNPDNSKDEPKEETPKEEATVPAQTSPEVAPSAPVGGDMGGGGEGE